MFDSIYIFSMPFFLGRLCLKAIIFFWSNWDKKKKLASLIFYQITFFHAELIQCSSYFWNYQSVRSKVFSFVCLKILNYKDALRLKKTDWKGVWIVARLGHILPCDLFFWQYGGRMDCDGYVQKLFFQIDLPAV